MTSVGKINSALSGVQLDRLADTMHTAIVVDPHNIARRMTCY
jgi:hypothetical protein